MNSDPHELFLNIFFNTQAGAEHFLDAIESHSMISQAMVPYSASKHLQIVARCSGQRGCGPSPNATSIAHHIVGAGTLLYIAMLPSLPELALLFERIRLHGGVLYELLTPNDVAHTETGAAIADIVKQSGVKTDARER